jgi:hypothetical protein
MLKIFPVLDELPALVDVNQALTLRDYFAINASDGDIATAQHEHHEEYRILLTRTEARYYHADQMLLTRGSV